MKKTIIPTDQITEEVIEGWKKQYRVIRKLVVEDEIDQGGETVIVEKVMWLKMPERKDLSYASAASTGKTPGQVDGYMFNESILRNCMLGGDEEIITRDDLFLGASSVMGELLEVKQARLEKV